MPIQAIKTPKPRDWAEACVPTPDQLVRWFKAMTRAEQHSFMERITIDGAAGHRCLQMDHDGELEMLRKQGPR